MKTLPKVLTIFFLVVFILQLAVLLFLTLAPNTSQAADIQFKPQVIQDLGYDFNPNEKSTANIANLVRAIYKYAIGLVGILAAVVLMIGGVLWIVAGGNATAIGEAKAWIGASLTGLLLALLSYAILATINPALVNLKTTGIKYVENNSTEIGCCQETSDDATAEKSCGMVTQSQCRGAWLGGSFQCSNNGQCGEIKKLEVGMKDCQPPEGTILGKTTASTNVESICQTTVCAPNIISNKSYYISVGTNAGGYCCICEKPANYCTEKGVDCVTSDSNQRGYCDGAGNCLTANASGGEWCGKKDNFGVCTTPSYLMCPSEKSRVWTGRSCIASYVCCQ